MARLFDSDNKYKITLVVLLTIFVFSIVCILVLSTIEVEKKPEGPVATVVNEGDLVVSYNDGQLINFSDNKKHVYSLSITNNSTSKLYYSIMIEDCNVSNLDIIVKDKDDNIINEESNTKDKLINLYGINANETIRYSIELKSSSLFTVNGILKVVNESLTTEVFADIILLNSPVSVAKTRLGSDVALDNEGLIESYDNDGKTYFFRGNVNNNYFKMGDLIFRIVRINGDNTVRVVLDDVLTTKYAFNSNSVESGQNVTSLALLSKASVMTQLNDWFNRNVKKYNSYIVKGSYCSDTTFELINNNIRYSDSYERIFNDEAPDLFCNGTITKSNVGLLNVDEVVLAGAASTTPNTKYYLYNKKIEGNYLTLNSYSINSQNGLTMINVMSNGALGDGILVNQPSYLRPVINIGTNAKIKGKGTIDNPYIIVS